MGLSLLLRFLIGRRQAVLDIAADPRSFGMGLLWVLGAALARRYDRADLLAEPWHLVMPLLVSTFNGTILFLLLWLCFLRKAENRASFFEEWRLLLAMFWMTAPLAWLYAVPVERFLSSYDAALANLWFLAVVAGWRVILYTRIVAVLLDIGFFRAFFPVMLFSNAVAAAFALFSPKPIWAIMGGLVHSPEDELIFSVSFNIFFLGTPLLLVWLIGTFFAASSSEPRRVPLINVRPASASAWIWPVVGILMWIPILPSTQSEQRLAHRLDQLLAADEIDDAARLIAEHEPGDFPPQLNPRPAFWEGRMTPSAWRVLHALEKHGADASWLELYRAKCAREIESHPGMMPFNWAAEPDILEAMQGLVGSSEVVDAVLAERVLRQDVDDSEAQRAEIRDSLASMIERAREPKLEDMPEYAAEDTAESTAENTSEDLPEPP